MPLSITSASICLDAFKKKKKSYSGTRDAFLISSPSIKERGKKIKKKPAALPEEVLVAILC